MRLKKRNELPLMAKLNMKVDIDRLTKYVMDNGLTDWNKYSGLKYDKASENGLVVRKILLSHFLSEQEKTEKLEKDIFDGGDAYKLLCLTDYDEEKAGDRLDAKRLLDKDPSLVHKANLLEKIHDESHHLYVPEADERNYTKRTDLVSGYMEEIFEMFPEDTVTRTRLAVLMPGEKVGAHIDMNTDLGVRIHVPILTHDDVIMGVKGKKRSIEMNWPADGSVWFLNQGFTHWVYNNSDVPRVHLIFSIVGQKCLDDLVAEETYLDT